MTSFKANSLPFCFGGVFLNANRMLPLVLCEDDLCLKGEEYKRRTAVLQSGSGSDLRNATLSPALPLAAAW